jgi:hypothetical protein
MKLANNLQIFKPMRSKPQQQKKSRDPSFLVLFLLLIFFFTARCKKLSVVGYHHIEADAASIGIPASIIHHLSPVPGHSGTGLVPAPVFLFITVPNLPDSRQSGIPAFKKRCERMSLS